ncbi:MAG: triphosphoribosyl-dephospho-CoA synthase [Isosphaeraceae bacterium]
MDFLLSAAGRSRSRSTGPAAQALGRTILEAVEATRLVVRTNTNLGMILLLTPLAAVDPAIDLESGVRRVLAATTVEDARLVYRAIRRAIPGGLGRAAEQDVADEPTVTLREAMALAAERDLVARQYADGFPQVLREAVPSLNESLRRGQPLETAIIACFLNLLARHPDSLIVRKRGLEQAAAVSARAAAVLDAGWPDTAAGRERCQRLDDWLRSEGNTLNPGTTADLVTAALFAALREDTIPLPRGPGPAGWCETLTPTCDS